MLEELNLNKVLFLDIETVPLRENYLQLTEEQKQLWNHKAQFLSAESPEEIYNRAGIYAEFGKIVCISVGYVFGENTQKFKVKSFYGDNEHKLLLNFAELLNKHYNKQDNMLCAHNGKEFDIPFIARRMLINRIKLPKILNIAGKKPWQISHLDTMELWRFGDYKHFTSIKLLANIFNIPTPKDDIDGSDVWRVYWKEKNLERIATYCQKDMITVAQVLFSYMNKDLIKEENIEYA